MSNLHARLHRFECQPIVGFLQHLVIQKLECGRVSLEELQHFTGKLQRAVAEAHMRTEQPSHNAAMQLARALCDAGDNAGALNLYKKILKTSLTELGPEHPDRARIYGNIGVVYEKQAKYPEALAAHQKSLTIIEKLLGSDHLNVAMTKVRRTFSFRIKLVRI